MHSIVFKRPEILSFKGAPQGGLNDKHKPQKMESKCA